MRKNQRGFSVVEIIIVVVILGVIGLVGWKVLAKKTDTKTANDTTSTQGSESNSTAEQSTSSTTDFVNWSFNDVKWQAMGTAPGCPDPLTLKLPVDVSLPTAVLYPGQTRNLYKPHGGFLFAGHKNEDITVRAPMDSYAVSGSRYIEQGEVQYLISFINSCGIQYRFDHLLTLAPDIQKLIEELPAAQADDTRTNNFSKPFAVKTGDVIATAVGHKVNSNVSVDFGVYDLRSPNEASKNAAYAQAQANQKSLAYYAVCWLDLLTGSEKTTILSLPGGDGQAGKTSDYCK